MRQQLADHAVALGWQAGQDIFQIGIRIMPIELGALNQTHDGRTTLARTQGAGEQPIVASNSDRSNLIWSVSTILTARRQLSWPVEAGSEFACLLG